MKILSSSNDCNNDEYTSSIISVAAQDPNSKMFITLNKEAGFSWLCEPLCYENDQILERLNGLLNDDYPKHSILQFCLFRSPDVSEQMYSMRAIRRKSKNNFLKEISDERIRFIKNHTRNNLDSSSIRGNFDNGIVHDLKLVITFKCEIKGVIPSQDEENRLLLISDRIQTSLSNLGLLPQKMKASDYIRFMQVFLNRSKDALWRREKTSDCKYQDDRLIKDQIIDPDTHLTVHQNYLRLGKKSFFQTLSARKLPDVMWPGDAISYVGDILSGVSTARTNYMVVVNIYYPSQEQFKSKLERKRQMLVNQSSGPLVRFVPILLRKQEGFDLLEQSMQTGFRPLKLSYSVVVSSDSLENLTRFSTTIRNLWREQHFELMIDDCCQLPVFINSLPLCADHQSIKDLFLYFTITSEMASPIVPIMGEWKGTGSFHVALFSRTGQLMSVSLHDSQTNKNALIAAESGSGKSFFANELLLSYLSEGAQIWVIDAGRSYKNLAEIVKGDFLQFDESSNICLNPFALIEDYHEDEDAVVSLIQNMASASNNLDEFQIAGLKRIMSILWQEHSNDMTIDMIANYCLSEDDKRIKDLGSQLFPFTSSGSYGKYFNGKNTIDFKNDFTVLELDELNGRRHLRQVVLLQLIYQIQQQIFLGERKRKKIIMVDEAWDLLKDGDCSTFIEHAYRKFRKYGGSAIIATQSINDLYNSSTGQAIAENSATMFLLGQTNETIESVKKTGRLALSEGCYELIKSVHTLSGIYSEIFIKSSNGVGVGRLIVSEFQKLLYSTSAEDFNAITSYTKKGFSVAESIKLVLKERGISQDEYLDIDNELLEEELHINANLSISENERSLNEE